MRWIRLTIHDCSRLRLPDVCPNCLKSPADTPTPIVRSIPGPFLGYMSTQVQWPFCKRCSIWTMRSARWCKWCAVAPAGILAAVALFRSMSVNRTMDDTFVSLKILLGSFVVAITGWTFATIIHWWAPRPDSCLSNFPTVKPLRGGKAMFSGKTFAVLEFLHPLYVEALLAVNDSENLKFNPRTLEKAKASFLRRTTNLGRSSISET